VNDADCYIFVEIRYFSFTEFTDGLWIV